MGLFRAEVAMFVDAAGEEVLHQAGLDALLLGNQRFSLLNRPIYRRENLSDFGLNCNVWNLNFKFTDIAKI